MHIPDPPASTASACGMTLEPISCPGRGGGDTEGLEMQLCRGLRVRGCLLTCPRCLACDAGRGGGKEDQCSYMRSEQAFEE